MVSSANSKSNNTRSGQGRIRTGQPDPITLVYVKRTKDGQILRISPLKNQRCGLPASQNAMSSSWCFSLSTFPPSPSSFVSPKAFPSLQIINSKCKQILSVPQNKKKAPSSSTAKPSEDKFCFLRLLQYGAVLASVEMPSAALAVTGNNNEEDLATTLVSAGIVAVVYLFVAPPIVMNWMRVRWFRRNFLEMYLQLMCAFIFFPGLMLWAPFANFRKFPRDPTMEYPWSTPKDDVPQYKTRSTNPLSK